jgi:tungstate transport system substrate-binding protein
VKAAEAQRFADWLTGPRGQALIDAFRRQGTQLFFPNAPPDPAAQTRERR